MPNVTSSVGSPKASPLPDGAYLLREVELTEKGQVTVQLRDQLKIYTPTIALCLLLCILNMVLMLVLA